MTLLLWLAGFAALFAVASALALYSFGRFARQARGADSRALPSGGPATTLDRLVAERTDPAAGASGLALSVDNAEAFARRLALVRAAGRSLDIASYIWRDDLTGQLLARELMAAADRGVRVRLLLDDVNVQGFDPKFRSLDGHPGIEVRLFNPVRARANALRRGLEMLLMAVRLNRRLHAKVWIADARVAITGGRNIGNEYFGVPSPRKRPVSDLDIVLAGPLANVCETLFDGYWNSGPALPIAAFWRDYEAGLDRFRKRLDRNATLPAARALLDAADATPPLPDRLIWTDAARMIADPPEKALGRDRAGWMPAAMAPALRGATQRLRLMTPYFVPGREGMRELLAIAARGVEVELLTNALSVTNHMVVHGAYRRYRRPLLAAGVAIREVAPSAPASPPDQAAMLHGKGFTVDGRIGFVGSFNFDLRSAFLNIEMGVLFDDPQLAAALDAELDRCGGPGRAWALSLKNRRLSWTPTGGGAPTLREPGADALRRGASWLIGHLPIHAQL